MKTPTARADRPTVSTSFWIILLLMLPISYTVMGSSGVLVVLLTIAITTTIWVVRHPRCPECRGWVPFGARLCRHCRSAIE